MLRISKRFALGIQQSQLKTIKEKLKEFDITILDSHYHDTTVVERVTGKMYLNCIGGEDEIEHLSIYLISEFTGHATMIF